MSRLPQYHRIISTRLKSSLVASHPTISQSDSTPHLTLPRLNYRDTELAYRSVNNFQLFRSWFVLRACSWRVFVSHAENLMTMLQRLTGRRISSAILKPLIYQQFAGGETIAELAGSVIHLRQHSVLTMINYSVEADIPEERGTEMIASSGGIPTGEAHCDTNRDTQLAVIEFSKEICPEAPFSSFKITGMTTPTVLQEFTTILNTLDEVFAKVGIPRRNMPSFWFKLPVSLRNDVHLNINKAMSRDIFIGLFEDVTRAGLIYDSLTSKDTIDLYEFRNIMLTNPDVRLREGPTVSGDLIAAIGRLEARLEVLFKRAVELGARVMIDAEQTYMQKAINHVALRAMRKYNTDQVHVYNTYQCYLKHTPDTLTLDALDAAERGYKLGVKLVRGAYMEQERKRATEHGYPSPIQDTKPATDATYHSMLDVLFPLAVQDSATFLAGSHNEHTVEYIREGIARHGIDPTSDSVYFGQLYGMCDPTTFLLAEAGYNVIKAVPYGPLTDVLPYLARRAQENHGVLTETQRELQLIRKEMRRRLAADAS